MLKLREAFEPPVPTVVLAEGEFGRIGGKTANGVVLHSEIFDAQVVVDSETAGESPRTVLGRDDAPEIPIVESVSEALNFALDAEALVIGAATAGGTLPESWSTEIQTAMEEGCDVVSGLHIFLSEMDDWSRLATECEVRIFDVRKPPSNEALRVGDGSVDDVDAEVVLTLGTDCGVGKRTTTFELYKEARERGLDVGWIATGQTGIMVGAQAGVVIDRVPADFTAGVVEDLVKEVARNHDLVLVEGQASLTHRAYSGVTLSILHGSWPDAVILADDPTRGERTHFEQFQVESVEKEQRLIEELSDATVTGLSTWGKSETDRTTHGIPAANVYEKDGSSKLLSSLLQALDRPVENEIQSDSG